ncbi:hypothetical protein SAMN04488104_101874 [Algoriphagus faecimaris]|uniref:Transmembrane protein n=1 Tax=Algoriphagus faecimaris TaxID=686796 RepID=A0A1G6SUX1_9BACT|nr:hypothetical protein [Algoriphagus faecimaris]SDD19925.1 hypothetical protein SAMN04488104_101874 [Algoriphagus faecimaris]
MNNKISLLLVGIMISFGLILLMYVYLFNPSRMEQGESLCLKYNSFYSREILNGEIKSISELSSDHGALEFSITERDTAYLYRIYEPIYSDIQLIGRKFQKAGFSFKLIFNDGKAYDLIQTCDRFYD